jgi:hypothetical protein
MDEEDGRPGPRARQFGPTDVLTDASMGSLRRENPQKLKSIAPEGEFISLRGSRTSSHNRGETE